MKETFYDETLLAYGLLAIVGIGDIKVDLGPKPIVDGRPLAFDKEVCATHEVTHIDDPTPSPERPSLAHPWASTGYRQLAKVADLFFLLDFRPFGESTLRVLDPDVVNRVFLGLGKSPDDK